MGRRKFPDAKKSQENGCHCSTRNQLHKSDTCCSFFNIYAQPGATIRSACPRPVYRIRPATHFDRAHFCILEKAFAERVVWLMFIYHTIFNAFCWPVDFSCYICAAMV